MNTQANAMNGTPLESQTSAPAVLLVGAARTVGEPRDLPCSAGGGWGFSGRLSDQFDSSGEPYARGISARRDAPARKDRPTVRLRGGHGHARVIARGTLLLHRGPAERASI